MKKKKCIYHALKLCLCLSTPVLLSACGGGGSDSNNNSGGVTKQVEVQTTVETPQLAVGQSEPILLHITPKIASSILGATNSSGDVLNVVDTSACQNKLAIKPSTIQLTGALQNESVEITAPDDLCNHTLSMNQGDKVLDTDVISVVALPKIPDLIENEDGEQSTVFSPGRSVDIKMQAPASWYGVNADQVYKISVKAGTSENNILKSEKEDNYFSFSTSEKNVPNDECILSPSKSSCTLIGHIAASTPDGDYEFVLTPQKDTLLPLTDPDEAFSVETPVISANFTNPDDHDSASFIPTQTGEFELGINNPKLLLTPETYGLKTEENSGLTFTDSSGKKVSSCTLSQANDSCLLTANFSSHALLGEHEVEVIDGGSKTLTTANYELTQPLITANLKTFNDSVLPGDKVQINFDASQTQWHGLTTPQLYEVVLLDKTGNKYSTGISYSSTDTSGSNPQMCELSAKDTNCSVTVSTTAGQTSKGTYQLEIVPEAGNITNLSADIFNLSLNSLPIFSDFLSYEGSATHQTNFAPTANMIVNIQAPNGWRSTESQAYKVSLGNLTQTCTIMASTSACSVSFETPNTSGQISVTPELGVQSVVISPSLNFSVVKPQIGATGSSNNEQNGMLYVGDGQKATITLSYPQNLYGLAEQDIIASVSQADHGIAFSYTSSNPSDNNSKTCLLSAANPTCTMTIQQGAINIPFTSEYVGSDDVNIQVQSPSDIFNGSNVSYNVLPHGSYIKSCSNISFSYTSDPIMGFYSGKLTANCTKASGSTTTASYSWEPDRLPVINTIESTNIYNNDGNMVSSYPEGSYLSSCTVNGVQGSLPNAQLTVQCIAPRKVIETRTVDLNTLGLSSFSDMYCQTSYAAGNVFLGCYKKT